MSIESFRETIPTAAWRVRVRAGEFDRTLKQVQAVERELVKFLGALTKAKSDEHAIEAVKAVVLALNAVGGIDGRMGNILETDEREVLVPWILGAARAAGMRRKDDVTEEWRDW